MEDITKILADSTLTPEQKAEKIKQINIEMTNQAIQSRIAREKEKQEKEKEQLNNSKTELEKRLEQLENERKQELELRYKDRYGDKYKDALSRKEKGYLEEDIDLIFKPKSIELKDFKDTDLDKKNDKDKDKEKLEKEVKLKKLIEETDKWIENS